MKWLRNLLLELSHHTTCWTVHISVSNLMRTLCQCLSPTFFMIGHVTASLKTRKEKSDNTRSS